jgi:hypothetical protein
MPGTRPLRIEQPRYRIHVRRPRRRDYTVICHSLDECLDVIAGEQGDRVAGSELTLESYVGGRYRPRMLWSYVNRRWKREALAA